LLAVNGCCHLASQSLDEHNFCGRDKDKDQQLRERPGNPKSKVIIMAEKAVAYIHGTSK